MKTNRLLFAMLAVAAGAMMMLASCGKDNDGPGDPDPGDAPTVTDHVNIEIKQSNSVANIQKAIQDALDWVGSTANTEELSMIYVTGSKTNGAVKLTLEPKGVKGSDDWWTAVYLEGELTVAGLELKTTGDGESEFCASKGGKLTVNGDVVMTSSNYYEFSSYMGNGRIVVNGNIICNGDADFQIYCGIGTTFDVTGNITAKDNNTEKNKLIECLGELTIGGSVTTKGTDIVLNVEEGGKVTINGDVKAPNGSFCYMHGSGSLLTVNGAVEVKDKDEEFIMRWPEPDFRKTTSDKPGYIRYSDNNWNVYIKE